MIEAEFSGARGAFRLDARFAAPGGGVTALFGPSGCGKTSVLRCVAGLDRLPGRLVVNGETWQAGRRFRPVHRRALGYVFQEASLFPHLGVRENLMFGARRAKGAPGVSVDEAIALLGLEKLFSRTVAQLSGGERQRVAIGRALLSQPRLLLMDEPLSALDRFSKDEILPYLERLHGALSIPVLYVSHDIEEVERLADTLILMEAGRVRAAGPAAEILSDPALPLARAARPASVLDGHVVSVDAGYGLTTVQVAGARLIAPGLLGAPGAPARLRVRAEEVSLGRAAPVDTTILNAVPARILSADAAGEGRMGVRLGLGAEGSGARLLAQVSRLSWDRLGLRVGEVVIARIKASAVEGPGLRQAAGDAPQARAFAAIGAVAAAQR